MGKEWTVWGLDRAGKSDLGGARANQYPSEVAPNPPPWQQASYRMSGASLLEYRRGRMHIAKRCIIPTECNKIHEEDPKMRYA